MQLNFRDIYNYINVGICLENHLTVYQKIFKNKNDSDIKKRQS